MKSGECAIIDLHSMIEGNLPCISLCRHPSGNWMMLWDSSIFSGKADFCAASSRAAAFPTSSLRPVRPTRQRCVYYRERMTWLYHLNATTAGIKTPIKAIIDELDTFPASAEQRARYGRDQYFNKKQQLKACWSLSRPKIDTFIASRRKIRISIFTTRFKPLHMFEFKPVEASDMQRAVDRAFDRS